MSHSQGIATSIADVFLFDRVLHSDDRGHFQRLYCKDALNNFGVDEPVVQVNHSYTKKKGTVRGMHYQLPPSAETKVITCLSGEVFDVALDLRIDSSTFLRHVSAHLSASKHQSIVIPKGFAHGFQTLTDNVELLYFHTANYDPVLEAGISPLDKSISIQWPVNIEQISNKDKGLPHVDEKFKGISL